MIRSDFITELKKEWYPMPGTQNDDDFPSCGSLSGAFFYRLIPNPIERKKPEFVYIDGIQGNGHTDLSVFVSEWNLAWEAGHLRSQMFAKKYPEQLSWLQKYTDANIYLLPKQKGNNYYAHQHLLNLLPARLREQFDLPRVGKGIWPYGIDHWYLNKLLPKDYDNRLSNAFARHIWPYLNRSSSLNKFSKSEPIALLSHNLNFWSPFLHQIIEEYLLDSDEIPFESEKDRKDAIRANKRVPKGMTINRPRYGGFAWWGKEEALEVTQELVEAADSNGKLRAIVDAVKSNRIQDDFSSVWGYEKEDFERKLYHKRNKIKVSFVEIDDTIPVHGKSSEIHEKLIWEDFFAVLNPKEKQIVICLKNGVTKLTEVSKLLGYANHSPVSKAMTGIRLKAKKLLDL